MMHPSAITSAIQSHFGYAPTVGQLELINKLAIFLCTPGSDKIFIISGYAGTGKTSLVSALVKTLPEFRIGSVLLAPTGRAAKVLALYSGKPASTIHRKIYRLYSGSDGGYSMQAQNNQHRNTLFIIDEASMINDQSPDNGELFGGVRILEDLINYVRSGENCRMILIGDHAQLPPVGSDESPALDIPYLKASFQLSIEKLELTEVVRQASGSGILDNATSIRELIRKKNSKPPFFCIGQFKDIRAISGMDLEDALHTAYSGGEREDTLIICRSNKRANLYNNEIRHRILGYDNELNAGDLVMAVRNNYFWLSPDSHAGFIANGDILEIMRVRKIIELYGFRFADVQVRMIDYPEEKDMDVRIMLDTLSADGPALSRNDYRRLYDEMMKDYAEIPSKRERERSIRTHPCFNAIQIKFSYALTCHKAQGGQWKHIFVEQGYLREEMIDMAYLRWLYTAVTRATERLFLVNFGEQFFTGD